MTEVAIKDKSKEKFIHILTTLKEIQEKREKITDFFESELCSDSWAIFNFAEELDLIIIRMLADEFNCWYDTWATETDKQVTEWWKEENKYKLKENDIEYWLYEEEKDGKKFIEVNGEKVDITTPEDFYEYLLKSYLDKNKK